MADPGRPTKYTNEIADLICNKISTSNKGLHVLCKEDESLPHVATIYRWLNDKKDFCDKYARARGEQADLLADEIIEIADDTSNDTINTEDGEIPNTEWIQRSRLRVDARKWKASKLAPKKYGDKQEIEIKNPLDLTKLSEKDLEYLDKLTSKLTE